MRMLRDCIEFWSRFHRFLQNAMVAQIRKLRIMLIGVRRVLMHASFTGPFVRMIHYTSDPTSGVATEELTSSMAALSVSTTSASEAAAEGTTSSSRGRSTDYAMKASGTLHTPDILSIAPMMDWTTRHYRYMIRLITKRTRLYTEMVVDKTLIHSKIAESFLFFDPVEHPIVIQLGGSDPADLVKAAKMAEAAGYDEINLNCGCPSDKVAGKGCFGAALMRTPELVRDCVAAMRAEVSIPVSVKCRLGVDDIDSYEAFANFIRIVAGSGCTHFIVHARKCLLKGLSTKENRTIPPLRYHWVQRAAFEFPHLRISINGGVASLDQALALLRIRASDTPSKCLPDDESVAKGVDGYPLDPSLQLYENCVRSEATTCELGMKPLLLDSVMIGRMAYNEPWALRNADSKLFGTADPGLSRRQVIERYLDYAEALMASIPEQYRHTSLYRPVEFGKPLVGLFHGEIGGAKYRGSLLPNITEHKMPLREAVMDALKHIPPEVLDELPG